MMKNSYVVGEENRTKKPKGLLISTAVGIRRQPSAECVFKQIHRYS